jgi:sulfoxide reductase heme-binding subunit YedZ
VVLKPALLARLLAHALALTPMLWLLHDAWFGQLGADPVAALTHRSGDWALRLLLLTLAVTPLRRFTGWRWPLSYRRMLGLHTFAYACLHFSVYLVLDLGGYWAQILDDVVKRPFITVGFLAWLGLLPLAATSNRAAMRQLGRRWGLLHRLVYPIAVLAVLHFIWQVKADLREPLIYAAVLAALLLARWRWRGPGCANPGGSTAATSYRVGQATPIAQRRRRKNTLPRNSTS